MRPCSRKRPTIDLTRIFSESPSTPWPQAANAAHHQFDRHAGARRAIQRVDDVGIDQRIHFHPDRCRTAGFGVGDLLVDVIDNPLAQSQRRHCHAFELGRLCVAGHIVEHAGDVAGDDGIGGEKRQIGINACRHRMIIAGADMHVRSQRTALAPNHQRQLRMRLELNEAVDDLHAGALEIARPADIGLFVEARLELDHRGDRFAGLGSLRQRLDDR